MPSVHGRPDAVHQMPYGWECRTPTNWPLPERLSTRSSWTACAAVFKRYLSWQRTLSGSKRSSAAVPKNFTFLFSSKHMPTRVLFLCTGNSCRSQMAEGWARHLKGETIEPYSAGLDLNPLNPSAVHVMAEVGIDISGQRPKHISDLRGIDFDFVVTVCDSANESCPVLPAEAKRLHVGFDDPPRLAGFANSDEDKLQIYRRVRDEIRAFVDGMPGTLEAAK